MISVPYKSAFGSFRPNAAEIKPDGEIKAEELPVKEEEPVDMRSTPTASTPRFSFRSSAPAEESVPVEVREAAGAGTELPEAPAADTPTTDREIGPAVEPPITDEEIEEMFEEETHFEDDPPSKAQKIKAGLAVAGSLGLLYFVARKALR